MKIKIQPAFIAAAVLALGGIVLGVRAIFPASHGPQLSPEHRHTENPPDGENDGVEHVAPWFSESSLAGQFITPTPETVDALAQEAADQAASALTSLTPGTELDGVRSRAFVNLFAENLRLQLNPDFEAHEEWIAMLGGTSPYLAGAENTEGYRTAVVSQSAIAAMAPIATDAVRVRARFLRGREIAVERSYAGLTLRNPTMFDIPEDAERGALDVYEVIVPMTLPTLPEHPLGKSEGRAAFATGYGYAWSPARNEWIPWRIWIYYPDDNTNTYSPNFP